MQPSVKKFDFFCFVVFEVHSLCERDDYSKKKKNYVEYLFFFLSKFKLHYREARYCCITSDMNYESALAIAAAL